MLADFHKVGMTPNLRVRVKPNVTREPTIPSHRYGKRIVDGILSTPGDLLMSSLLRISCTSNAVVVTFSNKFGFTTSVVRPLTSAESFE